jgi:hypothetical protein
VKHKAWSSDIPRVGAGLPKPARSADPCPRWPAGATHDSVDELDRWPRLLDQDPIKAGVTQAILPAPADGVELHHAAGRHTASHRVNVATRGPLTIRAAAHL